MLPMGRRAKQGRCGAKAPEAKCENSDSVSADVAGDVISALCIETACDASPAACIAGPDGSCDEIEKLGENTSSTAELQLAVALAEFLQARYPGGITLGALAGSDVRQGLREPMRDAGIRSFKAKWLQRFPEHLIIDTKNKTLRAAGVDATAIRAAEVGGKVVLECTESSERLVCTEMLRSCLRQQSAAVGIDGDVRKKDVRITFTDLVDTLLFKVGHDPKDVAKKGQHVKRPMVTDDNEHDDGPPAATMRPALRKANKEAWLNPVLLPPVHDDEDSD